MIMKVTIIKILQITVIKNNSDSKSNNSNTKVHRKRFGGL